jgi:hypothetical protein
MEIEEIAIDEALAFIKNAVADPVWVGELVDVYDSTDAIAVDRRMTG